MRPLFAVLLGVLALAGNAHAMQWDRVDGAATDVGVGAGGAVWVIGANAIPGGFAIYRRDGAAWTHIPGGAVRIAVEPSGNAWVVNSSNAVFRYTGTTWEPKPGSVTDIAIGADNIPWAIGADGGIYRWSGSNWTRMPGGATRIAVGQQSVPWVVNSANQIFRWNGSGWDGMPGAAKAIGAGSNGAIWAIGLDDKTYQWNGSNWTAQTGTGAQIAVGPTGQVWVVQNDGAIFSSRQTAVAGTSPSTTSGTLVTATQPVPTTTQQPLTVSGYTPEPVVPTGTAICPLFGGSPSRLTLGCDFQKASATQVANPAACPAGAFMDPRNGGECWSCPTGYTRSAAAVTEHNACWKPVTEDIQPATWVKNTGCGAGFLDVGLNQCWSCPSGFNRTLDAVTAGTACSQGVFGPFSAASRLPDPGGACTAPSFHDPIRGGSCWTCPSGYRRSAASVEASNACALTIPTQYAHATLQAGCSQAAVPQGFGPAMRDPRNGGECWACPLQYSRSWMAVTGDSACKIEGGSNALLWQLPQYPDPGVQRFAAGIAAAAFRDARQVDAFLARRAGGNAAAKAALWDKMAREPNNSPELKAILFTGLLSEATSSAPSAESQQSIRAFQTYVQNRRTFAAKEAAAMYNYWLGINAGNQFAAARASLGGFAGVSSDLLGAAPPGDFTGIAYSATGADERGQAFLDAFAVLGSIAGAATFTSASTIPNDAFDPGIVLNVWSAIMIGLDAADFLSLVSLSSSVSNAMLGGQLVRQVVEAVVTVGVMLEQAEAERTIRESLAEAAAPIDVRRIMTSGTPEEKIMLTHFWATATSPFRTGGKVGEGALTDAALCNASDPTAYDVTKCSALGSLATIVRAAQAAAAR